MSCVVLKLCDFGLARAVPETGRSTMTPVGTPTYFAPEVLSARTKEINFEGDYKKVDIYCCGMVFSELFNYLREQGKAEEAPMNRRSLASSSRHCINDCILLLLWNMISEESSERYSAKSVASYIKSIITRQRMEEEAQRTARLNEEKRSLLRKIPKNTSWNGNSREFA
jgi:serine/threonine protein kinase